MGPDAYKVVYPSSAPVFSFGSKFGSRVNNKEHLRPTKIDGPGPGSYKMPKQYQEGKRPLDIVKRTTFGTAGRGTLDRRVENPSPSKYRPSKFTEASHGYSFPRAPNAAEVQHKRDFREAPGPATYNVEHLDLANQKKLAKSMLEKTMLASDKVDTDVPGPQ